jgi:hypothetical protein
VNGNLLTIIRTPRLWMAKRVWPDKIEPYSDAKHFDVETVTVSSLDDIEPLLRARLLNDCRAAVVRGALIYPTHNKHVRRLIHDKPGAAATFRDEPRYWCALDLEGIERPGFIDADDLEGCARIALSALPEEFQGVECLIQATASHGIKPDIRLRGWFWLDRAIDSATLKYWLSERAGIDWKSIGAVNPIYTAKPLFRGVADPVPDRLIRLPGKPLVPVPAVSPLPPPPPSPPLDVTLSKAMNSREAQWLANKLKQRIKSALAKLSAATSEKHYALRGAAVTLGGYQEQAGFSDADAEAWLLAALGPSQTPEKDRDTIRSGLAYGRSKPLLVTLPGWLRRQPETADKVRPNGSCPPAMSRPRG